MLVKKITVGFVVQTFDTERGQFVGQEFVAGDDVAYEDDKSEAVDNSLLETDGTEAYLPYDMVQPEPPRKCVRVEYDLDYDGGDYSKVGQFAYIPHEIIDQLPGTDPDTKLRTAFTVLVGDSRHIVHYTFDETFDQDGKEWKDEE